jgi:hypothetical protein
MKSDINKAIIIMGVFVGYSIYNIYLTYLLTLSSEAL